MNDLKRPLPVDESEETASASEMTGLIPALPENADEADAYRALYPMPRQKVPDKTRR